MKTMRFLAAFLSPFVALTLRADPLLNLGTLAAPPPPEIEHPQAGSDDNSQQDPVGTDPDAVPTSFAHPHAQQMQAAQREVLAETEKKREQQHDWLLKAYERQLQSRDHASSSGHAEGTNLYAELTGDPDLAKLAGLQPNDYIDMPELIDLHVTPTRASLRPDPSQAPTTSNIPNMRPAFRPLITPLGSSEASGISSPFAAPSPITPVFPVASSNSSWSSRDDVSAISDPLKAQAPGVLDIPGLTAAESNPATRDAIDLKNEDLLPDELSPNEKPHHALSLELPSSTNAERLQKIQSTALGLPDQTAKKATAVVPSTILIPPPTDTQEMVPDPSPIRSHIDDPFDILR